MPEVQEELEMIFEELVIVIYPFPSPPLLSCSAHEPT